MLGVCASFFEKVVGVFGGQCALPSYFLHGAHDSCMAGAVTLATLNAVHASTYLVLETTWLSRTLFKLCSGTSGTWAESTSSQDCKMLSTGLAS